MHAIMIIDVQREFGVPADLVAKIKARAESFPLRIYTQFVNPPGSLFRTKLKRDMCTPGDPGGELVMTPGAGDLVLRKQSYGLLPEHLEILRRHGVKEVTVTGVDTDACVLAVMFSLWDNGIDCHIIPDLCWSSAGLHKEAVKIAEQQFGR
jgi:nicotinamidase-related amidase